MQRRRYFKGKLFVAMLLALLLVSSCKDSEGTITLVLNVNSTFSESSTDTDNPIINWSCVVLSSAKTACIYYYNGDLQTRSNFTTAAWAFAPGTTFTYDYVSPGATYMSIASGDKEFTSFHKQGSVSETLSGTINLMEDMSRANLSPNSWLDTDDRTWTITLYPAKTPDSSHD